MGSLWCPEAQYHNRRTLAHRTHARSLTVLFLEEITRAGELAMGIFGKCANCSATLLGGGKEGEARFCCDQCRQFAAHPGFCEQCAAQTTPEGMGGTFSVNLVFGTHLM